MLASGELVGNGEVLLTLGGKTVVLKVILVLGMGLQMLLLALQTQPIKAANLE